MEFTETSSPPSRKPTPPPVKRRQKHDEYSTSTKLGIPSLDSMSRDQVSRYALTASIDESGFEDVKFFAYSRRTPKRKVCAPRALFGNSICIRKSAPHFDSVLTTQGWAESVVADMNAPFPVDRQTVIDDYEYTSDSDLDDMEDDLEDTQPNLHDHNTSDADVDLVGNTQLPSSITSPSRRFEVPGRPGRIVFIKDMAYRTWRTFIFYSYFGTISFSPLRSETKLVSDGEASNKGAHANPQCSPKSMYRVADKYDMKELKCQAAEDIKSKLSPSNIFVELFSTFTSLHPEIQDMEVEYLLANLDKPEVMNELPVWINYLAEGRLPRDATKAIFTLISKLVQGSASKNVIGMQKPRCSSCSRTAVYHSCKACGRSWQ